MRTYNIKIEESGTVSSFLSGLLDRAFGVSKPQIKINLPKLGKVRLLFYEDPQSEDRDPLIAESMIRAYSGQRGYRTITI